MKLIHVTDTHLVPKGETLYGLNPVDRLALCVADINTHHADAAGVVVTGDLCHFGQPAAYAALRHELAKALPPVHLLIGNHDDRGAFLEAFPDSPRDGEGFIQFAFDLGAARAICIDTNEPGQPWGSFCERRARWLAEALDDAGTRPVLLFMHHPPFVTRLKRMDDIALRDPGPFRQAVAGREGRIRHLFCGHLHRPIAGSWRGIPISTMRATSHQVGLDFVLEGRIRGSHEPPAYAVVFHDDDQTVVHFHDYLDRTGTFLL